MSFIGLVDAIFSGLSAATSNHNTFFPLVQSNRWGPSRHYICASVQTSDASSTSQRQVEWIALEKAKDKEIDYNPFIQSIRASHELLIVHLREIKELRHTFDRTKRQVVQDDMNDDAFRGVLQYLLERLQQRNDEGEYITDPEALFFQIPEPSSEWSKFYSTDSTDSDRTGLLPDEYLALASILMHRVMQDMYKRNDVVQILRSTHTPHLILPQIQCLPTTLLEETKGRVVDLETVKSEDKAPLQYKTVSDDKSKEEEKEVQVTCTIPNVDCKLIRQALEYGTESNMAMAYIAFRFLHPKSKMIQQQLVDELVSVPAILFVQLATSDEPRIRVLLTQTQTMCEKNDRELVREIYRAANIEWEAVWDEQLDLLDRTELSSSSSSEYGYKSSSSYPFAYGEDGFLNPSSSSSSASGLDSSVASTEKLRRKDMSFPIFFRYQNFRQRNEDKPNWTGSDRYVVRGSNQVFSYFRDHPLPLVHIENPFQQTGQYLFAHDNDECIKFVQTHFASQPLSLKSPLQDPPLEWNVVQGCEQLHSLCAYRFRWLMRFGTPYHPTQLFPLMCRKQDTEASLAFDVHHYLNVLTHFTPDVFQHLLAQGKKDVHVQEMAEFAMLRATDQPDEFRLYALRPVWDMLYNEPRLEEPRLDLEAFQVQDVWTATALGMTCNKNQHMSSHVRHSLLENLSNSRGPAVQSLVSMVLRWFVSESSAHMTQMQEHALKVFARYMTFQRFLPSYSMWQGEQHQTRDWMVMFRNIFGAQEGMLAPSSSSSSSSDPSSKDKRMELLEWHQSLHGRFWITQLQWTQRGMCEASVLLLNTRGENLGRAKTIRSKYPRPQFLLDAKRESTTIRSWKQKLLHLSRELQALDEHDRTSERARKMKRLRERYRYALTYLEELTGEEWNALRVKQEQRFPYNVYAEQLQVVIRWDEVFQQCIVRAKLPGPRLVALYNPMTSTSFLVVRSVERALQVYEKYAEFEIHEEDGNQEHLLPRAQYISTSTFSDALAQMLLLFESSAERYLDYVQTQHGGDLGAAVAVSPDEAHENMFVQQQVVSSSDPSSSSSSSSLGKDPEVRMEVISPLQVVNPNDSDSNKNKLLNFRIRSENKEVFGILGKHAPAHAFQMRDEMYLRSVLGAAPLPLQFFPLDTSSFLPMFDRLRMFPLAHAQAPIQISNLLKDKLERKTEPNTNGIVLEE